MPLTCGSTVMKLHGKPAYIGSHNGDQFTVTAIMRWLGHQNEGPAFITPSSPWQNGYDVSVRGKLRKVLYQPLPSSARREFRRTAARCICTSASGSRNLWSVIRLEAPWHSRAAQPHACHVALPRPSQPPRWPASTPNTTNRQLGTAMLDHNAIRRL